MRINRTVALEHVDGDSQLLADLAVIFMEDCPRLVGEMRHSMAKGDSAAVERTAHSLKGRLAFFGMEQERELALKLEMSGRRGNLAEARHLMTELELNMETAMPEFATLADNAGGVSWSGRSTRAAFR
ncbi:MAG: Hpt domain-containing protein [Acidobacteria bacterium]|nr:Hpt domain-containing protein [Acidobacteriota bacterium]